MELGQTIMELRRELVWHGFGQQDCIHATSDPQAVRDVVFDLISKHEFRIDATILEKSKAAPQVRATEIRFYQYAWYYHFKHVAPLIFSKDDEAFVCAASIGTHKKRASFKAAVNDIIKNKIATEFDLWRHAKSQGERRRSSAGDEPRVARESGAPDYGVEANGEDRASRAK